MAQTPRVTVVMPIRNERDHIERSLGAVLAQDHPRDRLQVLVVDGMSDDGTRHVVAELIARHPRSELTLVDNPRRTVPSALNIALANATGDVIIRIDGHCQVPPDYVARCCELLERTGAECVGPVLKTIGETPAARAIAAAQSSTFGVGGVAFRTGRARSGPVDTVAFGAYRADVLRALGGFDEDLIRNQDDELNFRLVRNGGRIWMDPSLEVTYYSRASVSGLWRQYYEYGLYKVLVMRKHGAIASWRHVVPAAFVAALPLAAVAAVAARRAAPLVAVAAPYAAATAVATALNARRAGARWRLLPAAFAALHVGYGAGTLAGLWRWRGPATPVASERPVAPEPA